MVGKKKMGFNVYKKICEKFLQEGGEDYIFSHAFVTLVWNLMARSENVVNAHILHVHWDADCLVFRFVKSKGDQTGKNRDQEWHVYANPHTPSVCPVLALGCYIFANPGVFSMSTAEVDAMNGADVDSMNDGAGVVVEGTADGVVEGTADGPRAGRRPSQKGRLFPGECQYDRFMGCLHCIIEVFGRFFCVGYLSRRSGLALGKERCEQPCLERHDCLSANGLHLPSRDVEHGAREGALPSV
jgi:hypothetical protein